MANNECASPKPNTKVGWSAEIAELPTEGRAGLMEEGGMNSSNNLNSSSNLHCINEDEAGDDDEDDDSSTKPKGPSLPQAPHLSNEEKAPILASAADLGTAQQRSLDSQQSQKKGKFVNNC